MATALAQGFVDANLVAGSQIFVFDPEPSATQRFSQALPQAVIAADNRAVVAAADIVLLAVKPQVMASVTEELAPVDDSKLIVSIAAGVSLATLTRQLGTDRVIRVMPNTPCLIGKGASGYALGPGANSDDGELVAQLLAAVGVAFKVREPLLDAVTGLSGSGPAYVFTMIQSLSDGGVRMGLPRDIATALATQTVLGAAELVQSTGEHPAVLRDRVASPGGTTIAGLQKMEDHGVRAALIAAVEAATLRSVELGRDAGE